MGTSWIVRGFESVQRRSRIRLFSGLCGLSEDVPSSSAQLTTSSPLGGLNTGNGRFVATFLLSVLSDSFQMMHSHAIGE